MEVSNIPEKCECGRPLPTKGIALEYMEETGADNVGCKCGKTYEIEDLEE